MSPGCAIVTDGSRGLGLGAALAEIGRPVAIAACDPQDLRNAAAELEAKGADVFASRPDITDGRAVGELVRPWWSASPRIDVLVEQRRRQVTGARPRLPGPREGEVGERLRCSNARLEAGRRRVAIQGSTGRDQHPEINAGTGAPTRRRRRRSPASALSSRSAMACGGALHLRSGAPP
jgi:short chain dehydrogenase